MFQINTHICFGEIIIFYQGDHPFDHLCDHYYSSDDHYSNHFNEQNDCVCVCLRVCGVFCVSVSVCVCVCVCACVV